MAKKFSTRYTEEAHHRFLAQRKGEGGSSDEFDAFVKEDLRKNPDIERRLQDEARRAMTRAEWGKQAPQGMTSTSGERFRTASLDFDEIPSRFSYYAGTEKTDQNVRQIDSYYAQPAHAFDTADIKQRKADEAQKASDKAKALAESLLIDGGGSRTRLIQEYAISLGKEGNVA